MYERRPITYRNPKDNPKTGDVFMRPHLFGGAPVEVRVVEAEDDTVTFATSLGSQKISKYEFMDYISGSEVVVRSDA